MACSLAPGYTCADYPTYTVACVIGYHEVTFYAKVNTTRLGGLIRVRFAFEVSNYAAPDFVLDTRFFDTKASLGCYVVPGLWSGGTMSRTLITTVVEFNEERLQYIIIGYEYMTYLTHSIELSNICDCFIAYVNPYPRVTHVFYTRATYRLWT